MIALDKSALLLLSIFITSAKSSNIAAAKLSDGKSFLKARNEPSTVDPAFTICLRFFPYKILNDNIPLLSVRLDNLDRDEGFVPVQNRFLDVWLISYRGDRMKNGDKQFSIQAVHYNFKNNGNMGEGIDRFPLTWYHMCVGFQKTGNTGEHLYYFNGKKIFHGQNLPITERFTWMKGNKLKVIFKQIISSIELLFQGWSFSVQSRNNRWKS